MRPAASQPRSHRAAVQGNRTVLSCGGMAGPRPAHQQRLRLPGHVAAAGSEPRATSRLSSRCAATVTQGEPGLTLSGGDWFGHPCHCPPSSPTPRWLVPAGDAEMRPGHGGMWSVRGVWGEKVPAACRAAMRGGHQCSPAGPNEPRVPVLC